MYIRKEDYDYLDQQFNSLDNEGAHDFMELLLRECSKKTGNDEWMIYVWDESKIVEQAITPEHIISREMIDGAYRAVMGANKHERSNEGHSEQ